MLHLTTLANAGVLLLHENAQPHVGHEITGEIRKLEWKKNETPNLQHWPFVWILPSFLVFQVIRPCSSCGQEEGGCCCWVLRHFFTSSVISVTSDIEREKSSKFCSEALISAWGSFVYHKSTTWDPQLYFLTERSQIHDFYTLKKSIDPSRDWTHEPRIQRRVW